MRIIRQGKLPSEDLFEGTCIHCKTMVEFKRSEARSSPDPREPNLISVTCPLCQGEIFVNSNKPKGSGLQPMET